MDTEYIGFCEKKNQEIFDRKDELEDIEEWMEKKNEKIFEKDTLEGQLEDGRKRHEVNLDVIKKERAAAIDKLRKEMLMNIRNVKIQMLTMNEDQL